MNPEWITAIATCFGAIAILYLAAEQRKNFSKLRFDFQSGDALIDSTKGKASITIHKEGIIRNQSYSKETISKVGIVIWKKKRKAYSYFATPPKIIIRTNKEEVSPPFNIPAREAIHITLLLDNWPVDDNMIGLFGKINPSFEAKFCFETTDGIYFDESGQIVNIRGAGVRWMKQDKPKITTKRYWYLQKELLKSSLNYAALRVKRKAGLL